MSAVVADLNEKTSEVDTFIGFADALAADYRTASDTAHPAIGTSVAERPQDMLKSDRRIVELAVAELNSQKTTYRAVERRLNEDVPDLDTSSLSRALDQFGTRIERLSKLGARMVARS